MNKLAYLLGRHSFHLNIEQSKTLMRFRFEPEFWNTYAAADLLVDRVDDPVNAFPVVFVLGPAPDNTEAFKNVDYVVDAAPFNAKLFGALV